MTRQISRRGALAGGFAALSAGCLGRTRNIAGRDRSSQLTLEINAPPADRDPNAIRIARHLAENLNAVGIDARISTLGHTDLRRKVLINHNFDVYVGQFREAEPFDPDAMYAFTHSQFVAESGWQNPFGFTDINGVDELLATQRRADGRRTTRPWRSSSEPSVSCSRSPSLRSPTRSSRSARTASRTGRTISRCQSVGCSAWSAPPRRTGTPTGAEPKIEDGGTEAGNRTADGNETADGDEIDGNETAVNETDDGLIDDNPLTDDDDGADDAATLRLVTTDERITQNWNPIAAEYRRYGTFTSLLYDRLVLVDDGEVIPWLAADWEQVGDAGVKISLREADWHDGEPVTAEDVAFTYEFLQDTSLGTTESPVPTPTSAVGCPPSRRRPPSTRRRSG